uniref:PR domain zinc finger protein 10-like isoform X2 n=1 Tax=Myxine glutinosa TaxID=7769 RepID=UPI0035902B7E
MNSDERDNWDDKGTTVITVVLDNQDMVHSMPTFSPESDRSYKQSEEQNVEHDVGQSDINTGQMLGESSTWSGQILAQVCAQTGREFDPDSGSAFEQGNECCTPRLGQDHIEDQFGHLGQEQLKAEQDATCDGKVTDQHAEAMVVLAAEEQVPVEFDPNLLWCEDCQRSLSPPCPQHGPLFPIPNRSPLTLAYATLPQTGGVHARRRIERRTRLGPYEAPLVTRGELVPDKLRLKLVRAASATEDTSPEEAEQRHEWLDLSDENRSNWLMLVRPAQNHAQQNLSAYQHGIHIFVCTTRLVLPREELRVWLAAAYAPVVGEKPLEPTIVDADTAYTWPCYECPRRLPNWQELQKHLEGHDDVDRCERSRGRGRSRGRRKFRPGRRVGRPPKMVKRPHTEVANGNMEVEPAAEVDRTENENVQRDANGNGPEGEGRREDGEEGLDDRGRGVGRDEGAHWEMERVKVEGEGEVGMKIMKRAKLRRQPGSLPVRLFPCSSCDKTFCRPDKLKLHQLRHSDRRDFLCSVCGKQFKRKDKLKQHVSRVHDPQREEKEGTAPPPNRPPRPPRAPRIPTPDLLAFTFKCRTCSVGFRRRGMLVNHLNKRHPDVPLHTIPELMLPILRPDRLYFCQHCPKVYKSTSKRKSHILKNHPGCALPASIRSLRPAEPGQPDPLLATHTALAGTVPALPVQCPSCSRQYSSKAKMVQHLRKKHTGEGSIREISMQNSTQNNDGGERTTIVTLGPGGDILQPADLLTQAMSELSKSLPGDIRLTGLSDYQRVAYIPVSAASSVHLQLVQLQQSGQASNLDLNQLQESTSPTLPITLPRSPSFSTTEGENITLQAVSVSDTVSDSTRPPPPYPPVWNNRPYSDVQMLSLAQPQFVLTDKTLAQAHYVITDAVAAATDGSLSDGGVSHSQECTVVTAPQATPQATPSSVFLIAGGDGAGPETTAQDA